MPTASSSQRLLPDSQYTRLESKFVDIHRFQFVRDANCAISEKMVNFRATDSDAALMPVATIKAPSQLIEGTPMLERGPSSGALILPRAGSLTSITSPTAPGDATSVRALVSPRNNRSFGAPPPQLKVLFNSQGDVIWTLGRSRALEHSDMEAQVSETARTPSSVSSDEAHAASPYHQRKQQHQSDEPRVVPAPPSHVGELALLPSPRASLPLVSLSGRVIPASPRALARCLPKPLEPVTPAKVDNSSDYPSPNSASNTSPSQSENHSGARRASFKTRNSRLVRQLAKQSHALQEHIDAMLRTDNDHREAITAVGARLLGAFGYVEEMEAYLNNKPPLPPGAQYQNYHTLDQVAEVCVNLHGNRSSEGERTREANREVQWMSLLKQDVGVAARDEQLAGRQASPTTQSGNTFRAHASKLSHKHRHVERFVLEESEIARLADERSERESRGMRGALPQKAAASKKFSDQSENDLRADEDTLKQMLASETQQEEETIAHAKFGEKFKRKRGAVLDTSAAEARLAGATNTDVRLLGPQAVVDLTLYRKNPQLFSVSGQDVDPLLFPNFPFNKDELLQPRKEGVGISIFDTKKIAEDKALTDRYNRQNLSERLERTHIVRSLLQRIVGDSGAQEDEDSLEMQRDLAQWRSAAGQLPSAAGKGDGRERLNNEMKYMWHTVAREKGVPNLPKL